MGDRQMSSNLPTRFVGLHAHSTFSQYDGLDYPQEHIDYVLENGMDAWSLTDHGNMNGFCHAFLHTEKMKKSGKNFKFIPGCEMYVHPDLRQWKKDLEASKAKPAKDESIITPITAVVDGDDETTDVGTDEAALTVENEDETKSGKYNDPVKRRHHLVVLPKTSVGLQRLFNLVSRGYLEGFYRFPRVDYSMLKEAAKGDHLMISTACLGGPLAFDAFEQLQKVPFEELKHQLLNDKSLLDKIIGSMSNTYDKLVDAVGRDNVCLELQFNKLPAQHLVNRALIEFAKRNSLRDRVVVTCDSHYSRPENWKEREIYKKLGWLNYQNFDPSLLPKSKDDLKCELYPKNAKQVWESYLTTTEGMDFYDDEFVKDAIERTHDIVHNELGDIQPDKTMKLPSYVIPEGSTEDKALVSACKSGLKWRGLDDRPDYIERIRYELGIIKGKKFSRYFLTMKAIMDIAREHMLIGPGRGSAAGSLVAYVLGITNLDPIEYDLSFERFLNPSRTGAPDIDSDISDRDLLIELLRKNLGDRNVIPISNYNTFRLKSLIKDIARFYSIPFEEVNAALAPVEDDVKKEVFKPGTDKNLFVLTYEDAIKYSKSLQDFIAAHPEVAEPIEILFKQNRSLGRHAGGVIVSEDIAERMPLILARGEAQTPWVEGMNYKHLEEFGWIKFDLLGLETLRIIERCIGLILERREGVKNPDFNQIKAWFDKHMDPKNIDLNDQKVYEYVYHEGRFAGIFQLTQTGAQRLFTKAKPRSIIDIATLTSIYRPGPLAANVDKLYIDAKNNPDKIDYQHPLIKKVLESTYGCIIFQEQTMRLCSVVAGFPEAETDTIRRNIMKRSASKKDDAAADARKAKEEFITGAVRNGVNEKVASELYDKILFFSGYGFNASHAVSYAIDSYYCAWLLTYYEEEWLCAYLESMSGNDEKRAKAFSEVKSLGYKIVPIDVNYATKSWTILEGKRFMPSFLSCKGIGEAAIDEIIENRPYKNVEEMLWNDDGSWKHSKFNKRAFEGLVSIRAFDSLDCVGEGKTFNSYKQMRHILIDRGNDIKKTTKKNPTLGMENFRNILIETNDMDEWTRGELVDNSVKYLGSFNSNILVSQDLIEKLESKGVKSIDFIEQTDVYWFIISDTKEKKTKNGKPYLLLTAIGLEGQTRRIFCWGWDGHTELPKYSTCIAEITVDNYGNKTFMSKVKVIDE
jgi:DNA polymerase-3 subunit alpha